MAKHYHSDWDTFFTSEFAQPYFQILSAQLKEEYAQHTVFPARDKVFEAFRLTPFTKVKVVIIGQDPYHNPGEAHGLCFSVPENISVPPSLRNIFKELSSDASLQPLFRMPLHGNLSAWAQQGVLLLNAGLTVRAHQPNSHKELGWHVFTDHVIKHISDSCSFVVFLLWGNYAKSKQTLIDAGKHAVLTAPHPSPFSAHQGFLGCRHFSKANALLASHGGAVIDWNTEAGAMTC